ncbi:hypothetical protein HYH03_001638 [Edaphochlamys debaryana]|uniref:Uricase n=1 Tax=Edaphochlamys debaryana TaxID=47281 RepID=A0A836C689_9CHLO|nr:hypothetical protein HYH03_001638 [Edaphochlamys debaryana]|eukprot:KAG2500878.1 hypothetical protein HYH03_001638 [Edaphochlamys debaryana]
MEKRCSVEEYAVALAKHFVATYPLVSKAKIYVEQSPWARVTVQEKPHDHGYAVAGTEVRTCFVTYDKAGKLDVTAGVKDMSLLKTTQSGYEGFLRDQYTLLPESTDRIMASTVTCTWKYTSQPPCYDAAFNAAKQGLTEAFFGPPKGGIYSPSVQFTLYDMAKRLMDRVPQADSVFLNMPNLHFLPCAPVGSTFKNDVYVATSEPHGNIEAVVTRKGAAPHSRL